MTTTTPVAIDLAALPSGRPGHLLPVDTDGADAAFKVAGFRFGPVSDEDPHYRTTFLPKGWTRSKNRIVDQHGRGRVCIIEWSSLDQSFAHMHLTDLAIYLRGCVAEGKRPRLDQHWANRKAVIALSLAEVERLDGRIAELDQRGQGRLAAIERLRRDRFDALAVSLSPMVEVA